MMQCLCLRHLQLAGWKPGKKEAWIGKVDLLGRIIAHIYVYRTSSKCFSVVFICIQGHMTIIKVFILLVRKLRH